MRHILTLVTVSLFTLHTTLAQNVGIGTTTPSNSSVLDVTSTNKGILIPRMPAAQRLLIPPVDGLMVYDTDSSSLFIYEKIAWKRLRSISDLQALISGVNLGDVLVWNGTNWITTPKCSLFSYYFRDADGDGKGDKYRPVYGCTTLPGFVADSTDCDDTNASIYPGGPEKCNGIDDDCDGIVDEGCIYISLAGDGGGSVGGTPAGINCPGDCNEAYGVGTTVTLTASPVAGSIFSGWSGGGCTGTGTCVMTTPNAATNVSALFTLQQFLLSVGKSGTGTGTVTSTPAGINCGADCTENYGYGQVATLTAVPTAGSSFAGWSGGGCTGTGTCVVTVTAATSVTATFTTNSYTVSVSKTGTGTGTVTSSPAGINCGVTCSGTYNHGTTVTFTAVAGPGSTFAGWSGGGCTGTGTCTVTVTAATSVTATFTANAYTVGVSKAGSGTGTVTSTPAGINCGADCSEDYIQGTAVTLTAAALPGSTFTGWNGGGCSGTGTCTMNVLTATSVTATFTVNTYKLIVSRAGTGNGIVTSTPAGINCGADCSEDYNHGTIVTLIAAAMAGSTFAGWSGGGCTGTSSCTVTVTAATSVTATFNSP